MEQNYDYVLFTTVNLVRNFNGYLFCNKLTDSQESDAILKGIYELYGDKFEFRRLSNITNDVNLYMLEQEVISNELLANKDISAIGINDMCKIYANEQDHIKIISKQVGLKIDKALEQAFLLDEHLSNVIPLSFDKHMGYLTADVKQMGHGLQVQLDMFLPALTIAEQINPIINNLKSKNIEVEKIGCLYKLKYIYPFEQTIQINTNKLSSIAQEIIQKEVQATKLLQKINKNILQDKVFRAYGLLTNCFMIDKDEAKNLLEYLEFGKILGMIDIKNVNIIAEIKNIGKYSLDNYYNQDIPPNEINIYRAKYIKEKIKNKVSINII